MSYLQVVLNIVTLNLQCLFKPTIVNFRSFKNVNIYILIIKNIIVYQKKKKKQCSKKKKGNCPTLLKRVCYV